MHGKQTKRVSFPLRKGGGDAMLRTSYIHLTTIFQKQFCSTISTQESEHLELSRIHIFLGRISMNAILFGASQISGFVSSPLSRLLYEGIQRICTFYMKPLAILQFIVSSSPYSSRPLLKATSGKISCS